MKKSSNIKVNENPSSVSQAVPWGPTDGRMDRHDKAKCHFSQFWERAQ